MAAAGRGKSLADFDIAPFVRVAMGKRPCGLPRHDQAADGPLHRRHGRARQEFLQRLRQAHGIRGGGHRRSRMLSSPGAAQEAAAAVPDSLIDETALVGPPERIKDRLQAWQEEPRSTRSAPCCWAVPAPKRYASLPKPCSEAGADAVRLAPLGPGGREPRFFSCHPCDGAGQAM